MLLNIRPLYLAIWIGLMLVMAVSPGGGASETAESRIFQDQLGRSVAIPGDPKRVVALAPSITEIIYALNLLDRLAGVTLFSNYPPEVKALPKVGSYVHLDLERIVALNPDLCIAIKDGNPKQVVTRLESLGVPIYVVDPRDMATVLSSIEEIGDLFGQGALAAKLVGEMARRIEVVKETVSNAHDRPGVFFQIGISPIVSVGTNTFIHELIGLAGGHNLTAGSNPYPRYSREQVISLAPDIMVITSMARGKIFEQVKTEWQQWPGLSAVRNNRIYLVDSDLYDRASPRLVDALEELARLLHPDLFGMKP